MKIPVVNQQQKELSKIDLPQQFNEEIRKDLGHKNRGLKRGDILSLFVNDIDTILKKS